MIRRDDLVKIGQFRKPHGVKGDMIFTFTAPGAGSAVGFFVSQGCTANSECSFFICEMEGIFVPFRIEDYRLTSDTAGMVRLKDLDSDSKVRFLSNKEIYFKKNYLVDTSSGNSCLWNHFIGFTVIDERCATVGRISAVEKSTLNTLFIINTETNEILIPATEEMIIRIDEETKELHVALPEGLLDLR
jgi:16S rRNA processing protein RimM